MMQPVRFLVHRHGKSTDHAGMPPFLIITRTEYVARGTNAPSAFQYVLCPVSHAPTHRPFHPWADGDLGFAYDRA